MRRHMHITGSIHPHIALGGALALSGFFMAGCGATATFGPHSFTSDAHPYSVEYRGATVSEFVGADWLLDNYQWKGERPGAPKKGNEYTIRRAYDVDDDGEVDFRKEEQFFDLRFTHKNKDAEIWLQNIPVSSRDARKELGVLADRYVEAASGSGEVLVRFGEDGPVGTVGRRFATKVISRGACTVAGRPAYRLDFEVANVDQLQISPNARWSRGRIVLVEVPFKYPVHGNKRAYSDVMLSGLSTAPGDFETLAPDFDAFLDRITVGEDRESLNHRTVPSTCRAVEQGVASTTAVAAPTGFDPTAPSPTAPSPTAPAPAAPMPAGPVGASSPLPPTP